MTEKPERWSWPVTWPSSSVCGMGYHVSVLAGVGTSASASRDTCFPPECRFRPCSAIVGSPFLVDLSWPRSLFVNHLATDEGCEGFVRPAPRGGGEYREPKETPSNIARR